MKAEKGDKEEEKEADKSLDPLTEKLEVMPIHASHQQQEQQQQLQQQQQPHLIEQQQHQVQQKNPQQDRHQQQQPAVEPLPAPPLEPLASVKKAASPSPLTETSATANQSQGDDSVAAAADSIEDSVDPVTAEAGSSSSVGRKRWYEGCSYVCLACRRSYDIYFSYHGHIKKIHDLSMEQYHAR